MSATGGAALRHPDRRLAERRTHHDPTPRIRRLSARTFPRRAAEPLLPGSDSTEPSMDPTQGTPRDDRDGARHCRYCGRDAVLTAVRVRTGRAGDGAEVA